MICSNRNTFLESESEHSFDDIPSSLGLSLWIIRASQTSGITANLEGGMAKVHYLDILLVKIPKFAERKGGNFTRVGVNEF